MTKELKTQNEAYQQALKSHGDALLDAQLQEQTRLSQANDDCIRDLQNQHGLDLEAKDNHLANICAIHQNQLNDKEVHIQNLTYDHARQLADKDTHIHHLNLQMIALTSSRSFRITRPLRLAERLVLKVKRARILLKGVIHRNGGLGQTLRKVVKILRSGGMSELKTSIRRARANYGNIIAINQLDGIPETGYGQWVRQFDTLTDADRETMHTAISHWSHTPLISILMPVYNPHWKCWKKR